MVKVVGVDLYRLLQRVDRVHVAAELRAAVRYPELVCRLLSLGLEYRLDGGWRKLDVKDWRRRSGVLAVRLVDDVWAYVRVERGYVRRVQVVGECSRNCLERLVLLLRVLFCVAVSIEDVVKGLAGARPDPNRLRMLSWSFLRRVDGSWLPVTELNRYVCERVANEMKVGTWLEVVAPPRSGKSSGAIYGLMKWVVGNNIRRYVVLVVAPNRRLAWQLYRYCLGAWVRLYEELRLIGWSRARLAERVRIRLYLGQEDSCMLNEKHDIEKCMNCTLMRLYDSKWRKLDPVPVLDNYLLKLCGYCPYRALYSSAFWRNSFVVVVKDALDFVLRIIFRHGIRIVVLLLDEYWEHLRKRIVAKKIDIKKIPAGLLKLNVEVKDCSGSVKSYTLEYVVNRINEIIDAIDAVARRGVEKYTSSCIGCVLELENFLFETMDRVFVFDFDENDVAELTRCVKLLRAAYRILDEFCRRYRHSVLYRLRKYVYDLINFVFFAVEQNGSVSALFNVRWGVSRNGKLHLKGYWGSWLRSRMQFLYDLAALSSKRSGGKRDVCLFVVSTSVDDSDVYGRFVIYPHESLKHVKIDVGDVRRVVVRVSTSWRFGDSNDLVSIVRKVLREPCNDVLIVNKSMLLFIADELMRAGYRVEYGGEPDRGVIDYVVVEKPRRGRLLLLHPHGRSSMGVDPPIDRVDRIVLLFGVRSRASDLMYVPRKLRKFLPLVFRRRALVHPLFNCYAAYFSSEFAYVYDIAYAKYDLHLVVQVVGRWFMKSVNMIVVNGKYNLLEDDVRYYLLLTPLRLVEGWKNGCYAVLRDVVEKVNENYGAVRIAYYQQYDEFDDAVRSVIKRCEARSVALDVMRCAYRNVRYVYNSLRYARRQLAYRSFDEREVAWLCGKIIDLLNGFEYARMNGKDVPSGLKELYRAYVEHGIDCVLVLLRKRYLMNLDDASWCKVVNVVRRMFSCRHFCSTLFVSQHVASVRS